MQAQPAPSGDTPPDPALTSDADAWARAELLEDLDDLKRMKAILLRAAEWSERQVTGGEIEVANDLEAPAAPPSPASSPIRSDFALAMGRFSRALRMTVLLRRSMIADILEVDALKGREAKARAEALRAERKALVGRVVTEIIRDASASSDEDDDLGEDRADAAEPVENLEGEGAERAERLETDVELYNRLCLDASLKLAQPGRYGDVLTTPVSEFIDAVCRDLGLDPDWRALAEQPWAKAEVAGGDVGAPLCNPPSPLMGEGSGMGVKAARPLRKRIPVDAPKAEPLSPPIPALSPIKGERKRSDDDDIPWVHTANGSKIHDPGPSPPPDLSAFAPRELEPAPPDDAPPPPEPYTPPCLEEIYSAAARNAAAGVRHDPLGLPGELPPLRNGRPAHVAPPCPPRTHGWDW